MPAMDDPSSLKRIFQRIVAGLYDFEKARLRLGKQYPD
jgi:hypothetical protein